jgi:hypothetical protein
LTVSLQPDQGEDAEEETEEITNGANNVSASEAIQESDF